MPPRAAPLSMKIIPLRWRGAGVGLFRDGKDPPPKAEAFCPSQEGIFRGVRSRSTEKGKRKRVPLFFAFFLCLSFVIWKGLRVVYSQ